MYQNEMQMRLHNLNNKIQGKILLAHLEEDESKKYILLSEIERLKDVVTMTEFFKVKESSEQKGVWQ